MKYRISTLLIILITFSFININVYSSSGTLNVSVKPTNTDIRRSESFSYGVFLENTEPQNIATYRLKLYFDTSKVECKGLEMGPDTEKSQFRYYIKDNLITIIYLSAYCPYILNQDSSTPMFYIKFNALKNAEFGESIFTSEIDGMANDDVEPISLNSISTAPINIIPDPVYDCTLKSLELSEAEISPEFSPTIMQYSAEVPASVNSVEVFALANDENASVKVNRKTLGKAGSTTNINVTVTAADKKSKLIYVISVKRNDKDSDASSPSSKSSKSSGTSNSSKSSSTSNKASSSKSSPKNSEQTISSGNQQNYITKNITNESSDLSLKDNNMPAFTLGIASITLPIVGYLIYKNKFKHKK